MQAKTSLMCWMYQKPEDPCKNRKESTLIFPVWMIDSLDKEADRLGVTRQSIIKVWLAERLEQSASNSTR